MPITEADLTLPEDSPQLREFKEKVVRITNEYTSRHGHQDAARDAMRELGLLDPDSMPVVADVMIPLKMQVPDLKQADLMGKTQDEINALVAEKITSSLRFNAASYVEFASQVRYDTGQDKTPVVVSDVSLDR